MADAHGNLDLTGLRFDRLFVLRLVRRTDSGKLWHCVCTCGFEALKLTTQLRRLSGRSGIGCRACERDRRSDVMTQHGGAKLGKSRLYRIWKAMKTRCSNPSVINWKYYGGKGVRVCSEWNESFSLFRAWAFAHGYAAHLTIERKEPDGNYEPANCEWITGRENTLRAMRGPRRAHAELDQ